MLQAARSAPGRLREATDRAIEFVRGQFNSDGGARGRSAKSDLYFTVFALEGLAAMGADPPLEGTLTYLRSFGDGADLDFVHRACLARCWAALPSESLDGDTANRLRRHIEEYRSADGGYGLTPGSEYGTVYNCFLGLGAYQDLGAALPDPTGLGRCVSSLETEDGAFANEPGLTLGTTPATAAAAMVLKELGQRVPPTVGYWLLARCSPRGGFLATPHAPFPDLLSTATALHTLAQLGMSVADIQDRCLDFVDSLWTGRAFRGHWADDAEDCEYTYYALLALGHLSP